MLYTDSCPVYCAVCETEYTYNPKKFIRVFLDDKTYYVCINCTRECIRDKLRGAVTVEKG